MPVCAFSRDTTLRDDPRPPLLIRRSALLAKLRHFSCFDNDDSFFSDDDDDNCYPQGDSPTFGRRNFLQKMKARRSLVKRWDLEAALNDDCEISSNENDDDDEHNDDEYNDDEYNGKEYNDDEYNDDEYNENNDAIDKHQDDINDGSIQDSDEKIDNYYNTDIGDYFLADMFNINDEYNEYDDYDDDGDFDEYSDDDDDDDVDIEEILAALPNEGEDDDKNECGERQRRVSFRSALVTEVRWRPATTAKEKADLFFTASDYARMLHESTIERALEVLREDTRRSKEREEKKRQRILQKQKRQPKQKQQNRQQKEQQQKQQRGDEQETKSVE